MYGNPKRFFKFCEILPSRIHGFLFAEGYTYATKCFLPKTWYIFLFIEINHLVWVEDITEFPQPTAVEHLYFTLLCENWEIHYCFSHFIILTWIIKTINSSSCWKIFLSFHFVSKEKLPCLGTSCFRAQYKFFPTFTFFSS